MLKIFKINSSCCRYLHQWYARSYVYTSQVEDHYKVLGLTRDATAKQIKEAYLKLSKKYHPDVCKDENAAEMFKKVNAAYNALKAEKSGSGYAGRYDTSYSDSRKYESSQDYRANHEEYTKSYEFYRDTAHMTEEERIYYKIFRRTFKEDPAYFYKPENAHLRKQFEEELREAKRKRGEEEGKGGASQADQEFAQMYEEMKREYARYEQEQSQKRQAGGGTYAYEAHYTQPEAFDAGTTVKVLAGLGIIMAGVFLALQSEVINLFNLVKILETEVHTKV
jgi:DnaJ-class molecular chaperone with C-terminal Zn finger domain